VSGNSTVSKHDWLSLSRPQKVRGRGGFAGNLGEPEKRKNRTFSFAGRAGMDQKKTKDKKNITHGK